MSIANTGMSKSGASFIKCFTWVHACTKKKTQPQTNQTKHAPKIIRYHISQSQLQITGLLISCKLIVDSSTFRITLVGLD